MSFDLPKLPYAEDALEPVLSARTLNFHHDKHHRAYVATLNKLVEGTELAEKSLDEVIKITAKDEAKKGVFNSAAQVWNHTFFWNCMKPNGGGQPPKSVVAALDVAFGSVDKFKEQFTQAATSQFGSGWAWLIREGDGLKITTTSNAVNPLSRGSSALLTCDVWEHAYYLDYQNRRADFVKAFLEKLVNWDFVAENMT